MGHAARLHDATVRPIRTLVVDDDRHARRYLRGLLDRYAELTIIGEAPDGQSAASEIERLRPDLVFLDIEMPGLDGFDVLEHVQPDPPHVIFVTGYDRYAVRAFDVDAIDYLVKPVDSDRLRRAVTRAISLIQAGDGQPARELGTLINLLARTSPDGYVPRIAVKDGHRIRLIPVPEIDWIEATDKMAVLHTGGQSYTLRESLAALEKRLDPFQFVRIHRSAIVNVSRIDELQPWAKGDFFVRLRDGTRLTTGPSYRSNVQQLLRGPARV